MSASNSSGSVRGKGLAGEGKVVDAVFVKRKVERDGGAWAISEVEVDGVKTTAVGPLLDPRPGAKIRLIGVVEKDHPTYGHQLCHRSYEWAGWADLRGVEKYLIETCDGIGAKKAKQIVDAWQEKAVEILRTAPDDVCRRFNLPLGSLNDSAKRLNDGAKYERLQFLLRGAGFGTARIGRLLKHYGDKALEVLQEDPWRVSIEVDGFGFATADQIALALGHPADSPSRGRAAVAHFVREAASRDGHIWVEKPEIIEECRKVGLTDVAIANGISWAEANGWAGRVEDDPPTTEPSTRLSAPNLFEADTSAAFMVREMLGGAPNVAWNDEALGVVVLDDCQKAAIDLLKKSRIAIVTGGPGTGKTHMLKAVWTALGGGQNVRIVAPTGKAAARIRESGLQASTIHRALGFGVSEEEKKQRGNGIVEPITIVDESSMVDSCLFASLIEALPANGSLWLFGDADQLPPVGPGCPFADMIESGVVPVARLLRIHRVDETSWLAENAKRVNSGQKPAWGMFKGEGGDEKKIEDFFFGAAGSSSEAEDMIVDLVSRRIPAKFRVNVDDVQVLSPKWKDAAGVDNLNKAIRAVVNPAGDEACGYRVNDRVIHTRNNYDLGVMNGEVGKVVYAGRGAGGSNPAVYGTVKEVIEVDFGDRVATYDNEDAKDLKLAYAITVHKSQGSQFPIVVVPVLKAHAWMLSRRLLYTGISRARKVCVLVGEEDAIGMSVKNVRSANRNTYLRSILSGE